MSQYLWTSDETFLRVIDTVSHQKKKKKKQKCYLDEKFSIGQETGHKLDAAAVARGMRFAKDKGENRRFTVDDILTPQQVQPYFSRAAAKLKNSQEETPEEDITSAENEAAYSLTRYINITSSHF